MMQALRFLREKKYSLFFCMAVALLLQGCLTVECKDCDAMCPGGMTTKLQCKDKSTPTDDGKCQNGEDAVRLQVCTAVHKACGWGCPVENSPNCDVNNPGYKCKTVWSGSTCIDCKCRP